MTEMKIEGRSIGDKHPVYIIAEIGYNFNTLEEGKKSIEAAADCGVDAVKFQTFRAETVTSTRTDFPAEAGATNQFEEFKRYEMSEETHRALFEHCKKCHVTAFSTPSYKDDVELLEKLNVPAHKVGSDDLTNLPFLRYVAAKGRPLIFSTGMGTLEEAAQALRVVQETGNKEVAVLHCVSNYPIKDESLINLRVIETYRRALPAVIGFSDHTTGVSASVGAVALGARIVERHFTLDKKLEVPDAFFSADPKEMKELVQAIRSVEKALGDGFKRPTSSEIDMRRETRKSVIAKVALAAQEKITEDKIIVKRPGTGVPPAQAHLLTGRRAKRAIERDEPILWDMVD